MNKDDVDRILGDDSEPNEPKKLHGVSASSGRQTVTKLNETDAKKRREAIANLLVVGADRATILDKMTPVTLPSFVNGKKTTVPGYGMTPREVDLAIKSIYAEWDEEEAELRRYAKSKSERRILAEIHQARADKQFGAVANLEKVLMAMQGTEQPPERPQQIDSRITDALLQFFGEMDPAEMRILIERERIEFFAGDRELPKLPPATVSTAQVRRRKKGE